MSRQTVEALERLKRRFQTVAGLSLGTSDHAQGLIAGYKGAIDAVDAEIEAIESNAALLIRTEQLEEAIDATRELKGPK